MVEKNKNEDLYSMWHNISNEIGKQLFDISNVSNFDYGTFQDTWKDYSEKMTDKFQQYTKMDENYYKNMVTMWKEFTESMSSQIPKLNVYDKATYTQWYDYWLNKLGLNDEYKQQLLDASRVMSDFWLDMIEKTTETYKDALNVKNNGYDYANKFQEFYEYWTAAYTKLVNNLRDTSIFKNLNDFDPYNKKSTSRKKK